MRRWSLLFAVLLASCANIIDLEERTRGENALCGQYCDEAEATCTGLFYKAKEGCLGLCAAYPRGDSTGNTLECRLKQTKNAMLFATEAASYCAGAGPSGVGPDPDSSCGGDACLSYCSLYKNVCGEIPDCETKCKFLPDHPSANTAMDDFASAADTVQCRLAHVTAAAAATQAALVATTPMDMKDLVGQHDAHCGHSGLKSNTFCDVNDDPMTGKAGLAIRCDDLCKLTMGACTGDSKVYESQAQCEAVCNELPSGSISDTVNNLKTNSRRCRRENAYGALTVTAADAPSKLAGLCGDASPVPELCGNDKCESYCFLAANAGPCSAQFKQQYGKNLPATATQADLIAACGSDCRTFSDQGRNLPYSVKSASEPGRRLSCRTLHLSEAIGGIDTLVSAPPGSCEAALGLPIPVGATSVACP